MAPAQRPADLLTAWIAAQEAEAAAGRFVGVSTRADPDRQIVDELLSILLVGHDASSACVAWTCHLLATHPDVQERVFAEVDGVSDVDGARWACSVARCWCVRPSLTRCVLLVGSPAIPALLDCRAEGVHAFVRG